MADTRSVRQAYQKARDVAVPLIAINTPDPYATQSWLVDQHVKNHPTSPIIVWDFMRGATAGNQSPESRSFLANAFQNAKMQTAQNMPQMLDILVEGPLSEFTSTGQPSTPFVTIICHNMHRWIDKDPVVQVLCNSRNTLKRSGAAVILLGTSFVDRMPAELASDVLVLDEPLPTQGELETMVKQDYEEVFNKPLPDTQLTRAVDGLLGLPSFPAEQAMYLSMSTKGGLNTEQVWDRKRQMIRAGGLTLFNPNPPATFDQIGGLDAIKQYVLGVGRGPTRPRGILFIDEIEKLFAGVEGDNTGVSQAILGIMLEWMQNTKAIGILEFGVPGGGKSEFAKAGGYELGIPTMQLGQTKASLVGESETKFRKQLDTVSAVCQGNTMVLATCNKEATLPPELKRRFKLGTFFFNVPSGKEKAVIWDIHIKNFQLTEAQALLRPQDNEWTGADISNCCEVAWRLGATLAEASKFVTPYARTNKAAYRALCEQAENAGFIDATVGGSFSLTGQASDNNTQARLVNLN